MFDHLDSMDLAARQAQLLAAAERRHRVPPARLHVGHLLLQAFYEEPDFIHQIDAGAGESQTNAEVAVRSTQLASAMRHSGLDLGDHVVIMGVNSLDLAMPFYASHYNGYGVCPMDPSNIRGDIAVIFSNIKPRIVFCTEAKKEDIEFAISSNELECAVVTFDGDYNIDAFITEFHGTEKDFSPAPVDAATATAWLLLTSGTTGQPKVAVVTYDTVMDAIYGHWGHVPFRMDVVLAMATAQWVSTVNFLVSTPVLRATRVQTSKPFSTEHLRDIINTYKPCFTIITPHIVRQFLQQEGARCDLRCLVGVVVAGSVVPRDLFDQLQEKVGGFVINAYGMTELVLPVFRFTPGEASRRAVGVALPALWQYRLVDEDGNDVEEPNVIGELWLKGKSHFKGYLNNPEETAKMVTADGWLRTGDLFYVDDQQCYHFKERKRVLIKYMSRFVAPMELEEVIRQHVGVGEVCVVGVPHPDCVQLPVAAITRRNGTSVPPEEIFTLVREHLPELKQLHGGLFFVDALPLTASGKVNRSAVLQLAIQAERVLPN